MKKEEIKELIYALQNAVENEDLEYAEFNGIKGTDLTERELGLMSAYLDKFVNKLYLLIDDKDYEKYFE